MKTPIRLVIINIFIVVSCSSPQQQEEAPQQPNILLIFADDLGYGDLGVYNSLSKVPTPNLDQLAGEGVRFTHAYCPVSVCSPTRYALMTGEYPWRSWKKSGVMANYEPSMIDEGLLTLPQMLVNAGYETVGFGKWHLGTTFPTTDGNKPVGYGKFRDDNNGANIDFSQPVSDGPLDRGFEHWLGFSCASECWIFDDDRVTGAIIHDLYTIEAASGTEDLERIPLEDFLPYLTEKSIHYLQEYNKKQSSKPFFLYFSPYVPHIPLAVHPSFMGKTQAGLYADYVHELDHYIGLLLDELEKLGLKENTLILFASDNGSQFVGTHPDEDLQKVTNSQEDVNAEIDSSYHMPNFPFRGTKWTAYEGGVRTPLIASWKDNFPSGTERDDLIALNDILPTLAAIVGQDIPEDMAKDGYDLSPVFFGDKSVGIRESVFVRGSGEIYGYRKGKWKIVSDGNSENPTFELFDLMDDPEENKNLSDSFPALRKELENELRAHLENID
ncbi:sulfatase family protein [Negadavirga shengliensis]|uniref:Arylsulfatase n=1 Tax=Negadavirga shengliensis TaxID=1389218 RepID=A0ABV9T7R5_9BACT